MTYIKKERLLCTENYFKIFRTCALMYIKHSLCISVHLCIEKLEGGLKSQDSDFPWCQGQGSGARGMGETLCTTFYTLFLNHENIALFKK